MRPASHLLQPEDLDGLNNMELIARSVVQGLLLGLHRSPLFGFSQEFAEYRPYRDGDDPRHVDWNVYARSERMVIKQFLGDTNAHLMILLDASASMGFGQPVSKLRYAQMLAACLTFLAGRQHDATGLLVFDEAVRAYHPPATRPGSRAAMLHTIEALEPGRGTRYQPPIDEFSRRVNRRGLVAVISDFFGDPEQMVEAAQPLCLAGHDCIFFQVLDGQELKPEDRGPRLLKDMESGETVEVSREFLLNDYPQRVEQHVQEVALAVGRAGGQHVLLDTRQPLGTALRNYLQFRQHRQ
ncbi:MAG: DUF58 domain-containing protein [Pseudomonadota bacterium]